MAVVQALLWIIACQEQQPVYVYADREVCINICYDRATSKSDAELGRFLKVGFGEANQLTATK
eukprot:2031109-Pyramimonas_sp.AAC.1